MTATRWWWLHRCSIDFKVWRGGLECEGDELISPACVCCVCVCVCVWVSIRCGIEFQNGVQAIVFVLFLADLASIFFRAFF